MDITSLAEFKLISAVAIWLLALGGGMFPIYVLQMNAKVTSTLNMAAAGIFLSASLVHMLPDAAKNAPLLELGCAQFMCFPYAFIIFAVGFLLILLIESMAHALQERLHGSADERLPLLVNAPHIAHDPADPCVKVEVTHAHMHGLIDTSSNPFLAIVVFAALSFHSLVEGLGIGAATSTNAWQIFFAIVAHKALAAMALSLELVKHQVQRPRLIGSLFVFASMTPLGVMLGAALAGDDPSDSLAGGVCTALAGGTFLYVGAMEIIPQELHDRRHLLQKCAAMVGAFGAFSLLALWV
ncbi:hypothetical protein DYB35_005806 [Aphanomyces astaci]|uniref:Zinc/iron permease n=1 Tax=Aphanomyces astaci TaxID=112090 RepID=A0A397C3A3_APHAT|nr:hypothetical protein DYB30_003534 [Aphanomyces astaci]RHY91441.1 hypothetical protein DYB35_005806 [Aphanomyces astaci]